jgi:EamA-like transporter family
MVDIGFDDIQKGVKRVRDTLGDLRAINAILPTCACRDIGASRAGSCAFVSPVIAVALGALFFAEKVSVVDVIKIVVMLSGAYLAMAEGPTTPGNGTTGHGDTRRTKLRPVEVAAKLSVVERGR